MKLFLIEFLHIFWGALILMVLCLHNGYPFLNSDSGSYILSGYSLIVPQDRPIFYGLFLRLLSQGYFLWVPVFFQSFILSFLIVDFFKGRIKTISDTHILGLLLIISLGTIGGWYAGQIMPDIFAAILFLSFINFVFNNESSAVRKTIYLLILFVAIIVHNSHILIASVLFFAFILSLISVKKFILFKRKIIAFVVIIIASWVTMSSANYYAGYGFKLSNSSHVFFMGRLVESGILKNYLDNNCGSEKYALCNYKDSLPAAAWEYVWNENSPLQKTGGWTKNKIENEKIIADIFTKPRYCILWLYKSIIGTFRQLATTNIDESNELPWVKFDEGTSPYENIKHYIPIELNEVKCSKQYNKTINVIFLDRIYIFVLIVSSLVVLFFWNKLPKQEFKSIYLWLIFFLFINAFITANFANVLTRLNSRVIWLLPLVNIAFIYKILQNSATKHS